MTSKKADPELRTAATEFVDAFQKAVAKSDDEIARALKAGNFSQFEGGIVELNASVTRPLTRLVMRAARSLGSKAGNEEEIRKQAYRSAQATVLKDIDTTTAVTELIDSVFEPVEFEFIVPNYLIRFDDDVRSLTIGRVKAVRTEDFINEFGQRFPASPLNVHVGPDFKFSWSGSPPAFNVEMHPVAWVVSVGAAKPNVEEEAKWLIDIAVTLLRLHFDEARGYFPTNGKVEPHPIRKPRTDRVGIKIRGSAPSAGASSAHPWYQVSAAIEAITLNPTFIERASLIFDPPSKSLAERVSQGLGWLTRGRQSDDRTERLLYFFTAIESLLSNDDKSAPIVQTIARHAGVLLTNDNESRFLVSNRLKKLYESRSALIHAGKRGVLWIEANEAQRYAEGLFHTVLLNVPLKMSQHAFYNQLAEASFGTEWPQVTN